MKSLTMLATTFSESSSTVALLPERCLRKRLNSNRCQHCLDACPTGALSTEGREVVLDVRQCSGCMLCVAACPQDALVSDCDMDALLEVLQQGEDMQVSCHRQARFGSNEVSVPCIGIFSHPLLAAIGLGNSGKISFNLTECATCCNRQAVTAFMAACTEVMMALSSLIKSQFVFLQERKHLQEHKMERRAYLTSIRKIFSAASPKNQSPTLKAGRLGARFSRRQPHKVKIISKLVKSLDLEAQELVLSTFGNSLSVGEDCNGCPLCKGICPTGAITIEKLGQGKKLCFEKLSCSGCGLCVDFCKKGALSLNNPSLSLMRRRTA